MRTILYKQSGLINNAVGCLAVAAGGLWAAFNFEAAWMMLGALLAVSMPIVAIALFVKSMGECVAIQFDDRGIRVNSLWGGQWMSWPEVVDIDRETVQQSQFFGLYKKDISNYLVFTPLDGGVFGKLKINEHLLDLPRESIPSLIQEMGRAAARSKTGSPAISQPVQPAGAKTGPVVRQSGERAGAATAARSFGRRAGR